MLETLYPLLVKGSSAVRTYMSIYNPNKKASLMVEAFECTGQVQLSASRDYMGLIRGEQPKFDLKTSRSSGHLVATIDSPGEGMYFVASSPVVPMSNQANMAKFKYTWYEGEQPYLNLDSKERDLSSELQPKSLRISVPVVSSNSSRILSYNYTVYLSNESKVAKSASQCGTKSNFSKSFAFGAVVPSTEATTLEIPLDEIAEAVRGSTRYYVSVACSVAAARTDETNNDEYRIVYNTLEVTNLPELTVEIHDKAFSKAVWVVGGACLLVVIAMLICFRTKLARLRRMLPWSETSVIETQADEMVDMQNPTTIKKDPPNREIGSDVIGGMKEATGIQLSGQPQESVS